MHLIANPFPHVWHTLGVSNPPPHSIRSLYPTRNLNLSGLVVRTGRRYDLGPPHAEEMERRHADIRRRILGVAGPYRVRVRVGAGNGDRGQGGGSEDGRFGEFSTGVGSGPVQSRRWRGLMEWVTSVFDDYAVCDVDCTWDQ